MRRALAFLTPIGRSVAPNPETLNWFPLVGAAIGIAVGGVWWAADRAWPPLVGAGIAVVADAALTGCLHLDGLVDAADGLIPPMDRTERLRVLRDPSVGAFGAVALVTVVLLRFAVFAATPARPLVVAGLWCGSRTAMAVIARSVPYARPEGGLATAFGASPDGPAGSAGVPSFAWNTGAVLTAAGGVLLAAVLAAIGLGAHGLAAIGAEAVSVVGVAWFAQRRIGGFTGDVLGAAGVFGETVGLVVMAAR